MTEFLKFPIAVLTIVLLGGCMTAAVQEQHFKELDVADFKITMDIDDDPMETAVMFSTRDGWQEKHGLMQIVWDDVFMRGYVDKKTLARRYQVYAVYYSREDNWPHPYQANYGKPLRTTDISDIHSDVDCSGSDLYGSCTYEQHVGFTVDEAELLRVMDTATPNNFGGRVWRFRIKNQGTTDFDGEVPLPEIVALFEEMNDYEQKYLTE